MHLFFTLLAQRLPNDSLNDSFFQTPPLHDANLQWLVRLVDLIFAVLPCVQCYQGNSYFTAPKAAPSGIEWINIFIQTNAKIKFSQVCACNKYANVSRWRQDETAWDSF